MLFNVWASMSGEFQNELHAYIRDETPAVAFPEINNISVYTRQLFFEVVREGDYVKLFKTWAAAGRVYRIWSFYADKPDEAVNIIRADIDNLMAAYPQDFSIMGAWRFDDGTEAGNGPWYPIPPQTINFMPDDENGDPATELSDVILRAGQHPRSFGSYAG